MRAFLLILTVLLLASCDKGGNIIGGVFFVCVADVEQERKFQGMSGDVLESDARNLANSTCESLFSSRAKNIVLVYKDGTQKESN